MKAKAILSAALMFLFTSGMPMQASELSDAIDLWLSGEDVESLAEIARLARSGETDAQLLLGQIDRDTVPGGFSDFLKSLEEEERSTLLRAEGVEEDINWLLALTDNELLPLGKAVFGYKLGREPIWNALELQYYEEYSAASFVLWSTLNDGRFDLVNALPEENYGLDEMGFLVWVKEYVANPNKAVTMSLFIEDTNSDKVIGLLAIKRLSRLLDLNQYFSDEINDFLTVILGHGYDLDENTDLISLTGNITKIAEVDFPLSIVTRACAKCTDEKPDYECIIQALEIVGGYKTLMAIRTPVENVIPASEFVVSERPVAIFEQLLKSRSKYYRRAIRSQCIADHLATME